MSQGAKHKKIPVNVRIQVHHSAILTDAGNIIEFIATYQKKEKEK